MLASPRRRPLLPADPSERWLNSDAGVAGVASPFESWVKLLVSGDGMADAGEKDASDEVEDEEDDAGEVKDRWWPGPDPPPSMGDDDASWTALAANLRPVGIGMFLKNGPPHPARVGIGGTSSMLSSIGSESAANEVSRNENSSSSDHECEPAPENWWCWPEGGWLACLFHDDGG